MFYLKGVKMSNVLLCTLLMQCIVGVNSKEYKSVFCWKCRKCSSEILAAARILLLVKTAVPSRQILLCVF